MAARPGGQQAHAGGDDVAGVPSFATSRAPSPVRLSATTVRASGAVRSPASNGS